MRKDLKGYVKEFQFRQNHRGKDIYLAILSTWGKLETMLRKIDDETDDIVMSNRQRLMATPYAMWASGATRFNVTENLNVGGEKG